MTEGKFRPDIEGMRAVAVVAVLLFHGSVPWARGGYVGVDVFFVISGFLITGLLLRELENTGTVQLKLFYARRARRLLPASILTLVATALMTLLVLPANRWTSIAGDLSASALYVVNWRFAGRSVDYLAADSAVSPVQHFWTLSVEEQFYVVWPLLMILMGVKLFSRYPGPALKTTLAFVFVLSFAWSVWYTANSPGEAYFVTTTRMWELALGGGLALTHRSLRRISRRAAEALAIVGVMAIGAAVLFYGPSTSFPSFTALLPTLGAAALLAAGTSNPDTGVGRVLSLRPLVWIGGLSYSIYLFHWPMVVGAEALRGQPLGPWIGTGVVALSILPAWLSYRFVENPLRHSQRFVTPPSRGLKLGLAMTLAGALVGAGLFGVVRWQESARAMTGESIEAQPRFLQEAVGDSTSRISLKSVPELINHDELIPPLTSITDDIPTVYERGCHRSHRDVDLVPCEYGEPSGPTVALAGDSHAAQWVPALAAIAERQGWNLITHTKSACPFGAMTTGLEGGVYDACVEWNATLLDELLKIRPELIVTSSSTTNLPVDPSGASLSEFQRTDLYVEGLRRSIETLMASGLDVVLLADTPRPKGDIPECLAANELVEECTISREQAMVADLHKAVAESLNGPAYVDMTPWICTEESCPPVIDNLIVWRDTHHLSVAYTLALAGPLEELLSDVHG